MAGDEEIGARLKLKDRKQFTDDAKKASDSVKDIGEKAEKADKKMRTMGGSGGGLSLVKSGISGILGIAKTGALALGALGLAAGGLAVKFVGMGMDAAETQSKFNTVFAGIEGDVTSFVTYMNTEFGIPTKDLQDAASTFGVFGKAAGVAQDDLAKFSTDLVGAGTDLASFYNAPVEDVFLALRSGLSGESEPLRQFGIFLSDASLNAFALEKGLNKTTAEMTEQEKVALRQQFIMENLGDAQGDLARTSGGLANQWKALKGRLTEAGTAIGTAFLPYASKLVTYLNDKLAPIVADLTKQAPFFADSFKDAFSGEGITTEAGSLVGIAERLGVAARFVKDAWTDLSGAFKEGGVLGVTKRLDDLMGTGSLLTDTVKELMSIFKSLGRIWTGLILPVLKQFNAAIPRGIRPLGLVATALRWIADNGSWLQPILAALLAGFIAFKVVSGILRGIAAAQALLNTVMAMNPIGLVVVAIAALAAGLIYAWKNSETFRNIVTGAFNTVKDVVMGVWNWINENWPLLLAILTGPIGLAVLAIVENWDTIKSGVTGVKDWIVEKFDAIVEFFTGLPTRITEAATGLFDGIKEAFRSVINWIIRGWNSLEFEIPGFDPPGPIGEIGGFTLGVPDIDELHSGGTTTTAGLVNMRPDEELIFLPPAASVVPISDNVNRLAESGGASGPVTIQVMLDRKVLAEAVYDYTGDKLARR